MLIALAKSVEIGIDIEDSSRQISFLKVAKRFFSRNDYLNLKSLKNEELKMSFFRTWVRKEAFLKAIGSGFSLPITKIDFFNADLRSFNAVPYKWKIHDLSKTKSEFSALVYSVGL